MTKFLLAAVAVLLVTASWVQRAEAQGLPQGSYLRSCSDVRIRGDTLVAVCADRNGSFQRTTLANAYRCSGEIVNLDGRLQCNYGGQGYNRPGYDGRGYGGPGVAYVEPRRSGRVPPGSYLQSCSRVELRGDTLVGWCRNRRGQERESGLQNVSQCRGDIGNNDGLLNCAR